MAIEFSCGCGQKYSVDGARAGLRIRCKKCGAAVTVPKPDDDAEIVEPEAGDEAGVEAEEHAREEASREDGAARRAKKKARKKREREEAAQRRKRRYLVLGGAGAGVGLLVCLIALIFRAPAAPRQSSPEGAAGFAVLDALDEDVPLAPDVAKRADGRRRLQALADAAPPFDPKKPPTMRSTLGHLVAQEHMEQWVNAIEERLKGGPNTGDRNAKYVDELIYRAGGGAGKEVDPGAAERLQRPAAPLGDRAGVVTQRPRPPGAWTAPSFVAAPVPAAQPEGPLPQFAVWPTSFGDDKAAAVRYAPHLQSRDRWEVWLDLFERTTGRRAAPAAKLWEAALAPELNLPKGVVRAQMSPRPLPALGALRHDASLFALVDPADPRRVDFFKPDGTRLGGLIVHPERRIDWLGWSASQLLTVAGGRLTAWDPATGKASHETDGGYTHVGALAPDRKWVVLWAGTHGDVLDTATGRCLGRCQAGGFSGRLEAFTLAPDGKRLAAAFTGWPHGTMETAPGYSAVVWNLETGKAGLFGFAAFDDRPIREGGPKPRESYHLPEPPTCAWVGSEHLLLAGKPLTDPATLIDLRFGRPVGSYKLEGGYQAPSLFDLKWMPIRATPDGRLWYATTALVGAPAKFNPNVGHNPDFPAGFVWHTVSVRELQGKDAFLGDAGREWVDLSRLPVQVEAKLGTRSESEAFARSIARGLKADGFKLGAGGTILRVEAKFEDSDALITFASGGSVRIPRCVIAIRWSGRDGSELHTHKRNWSVSRSKYETSRKPKDRTNFVNPEYIITYDFKGREPATAIREELVEDLTGRVLSLQLPELRFLRVQGRDHPIPTAGLLALP